MVSVLLRPLMGGCFLSPPSASLLTAVFLGRASCSSAISASVFLFSTSTMSLSLSSTLSSASALSSMLSSFSVAFLFLKYFSSIISISSSTSISSVFESESSSVLTTTSLDWVFMLVIFVLFFKRKTVWLKVLGKARKGL